MRFGKDFYAGLTLSVVGVVMLFQGLAVRDLGFDVLDNSFFPSMASMLLIIFSVGLLVQSVVRKKEEKPFKINKPVRIALFFVSFVLYVSLLKPFGFLVMSILFSFVSCLIIAWPAGAKTIVYSAIFSFVMSFSIWYIFTRMLHLMLP